MKKQTITVLYHYAQYIAITLSLWLTTAGYSSRFDNEDISHKIFWSVYGVGVLGLQMHSTGPLTSPNSVYFAFFLSLIYVILSFQWLMCGIALRRCRLYCLMQTVIMLVVAAIAFAASSTPNLDHRNRLFWTLGLSYPAEIVFSLIWQEVAINTVYRDMTYEEARKETDLPLHIQFHIDRFSTLTMMVLGQLAVAVVWHPEDGFGDITGLYVSAGCTFVSLVSLKILIFDIDFLDPEDHAIRRSRISGLIWLLIYPAGLACLALMGIGMALLVAEAGAINAVPEGSLKYRQYLTCLSLCAFLVIGTILRQLHRTPFVRQLRLYRQYERAILVGRIHTIQSSVQILAAVIFAVLPACKVSALMMLKMIAGTLLCIIGVNFIDEIALLQTVKKAREATRHNSFDTKAEFF
uniref:Uncharacterized protein n=1 Tax=Amorphochlora amoebiformis TaxID=1561963 RepID=A0A7S0D2Y3_9EUKA